MFKKTLLLLACTLVVSACATPPRFEYGTYEPMLYAYYKKPDMMEKFETALEKTIKKGESTDRLAPGLYAELGYLRFLQGDQTTAIEMFKKEASAFPEADFFMTAVVRRLNGEETLASEIVESEMNASLTDSTEPVLPESKMDQLIQETEVGEGA